MTLGICAVVTALALVQSPQADSLRGRAMHLSDSALIAEVRTRPLAARDAVVEALTMAVRGPASAREGELLAAHRLAHAYAVAWKDPFLSRQVAQFAAWPADRREAKITADSLRRAGIPAYGRDGPLAAIAIWRRALAQSTAIADTAGIAATLGNIGAALAREGELDDAERQLERARRLAAAIGDVRVEANALGELAGVSADHGDLEAARERYVRALALREPIGDSRGIAADQNNLGLLARAVGDLDEARRRFEVALEHNRRDARDDAAATNLVNLAALASLTGDFARAEKLFHDALSVWRDQELWVDAADALRGLGQLELRRGDYRAAVVTLREATTILDRTGPEADALATRGELASALAATGELQRASDELREALRRADSSQVPPGVHAGLLLRHADLATRLNDFADADRLYARAELLYRRAADAAGEAEARQGRGALLLERDDHVQAQTALEGALRVQQSVGDIRGAALTRLWLGHAALERGDTASARRQTARAAFELEHLGDPVALAAAIGERAAVEAAVGLPAAAESLYRAGLRHVRGRVAPEVTWRLHAGLALARRSQGFADDAVRELRSAIAGIEASSRSIATAERRSGFLADKWEVHAQLAFTEISRGRVDAAFDASERLRAREMLELLARGRLAAPRDTADELIAREQDLRRRISELTRELEGVGSERTALRGPDASRATEVTREALTRAQDEYVDLLAELREEAPAHEGLVVPRTATWREIARRLGSGEALVEYLVSDSGSVAFIVTRDTVAAVDLGVAQREIARLIEFARGTLEPDESRRTGSLWRGPLRQLHRYLIAPIEESGVLTGTTRLVIVAHAELHYLPFAALIGADGRVLVQRYELAVAPSASVWVTLGRRTPPKAGAGVLAVAPRPDALPASLREVEAVGRLAGPGARVLMGDEATELAFRREAPRRRVLHLATLGVLNKHNPLFSFIELVPGGAHDGRLEVHEVFGLTLAADLVVLSACQTGLGSGALADVPTGDDWVGLTRAFLHAGAARVVATLWPVDDWATAALMERFYEALASDDDPVRALARAQRAVRDARATADPFYWAGFVIVGGAGN